MKITLRQLQVFVAIATHGHATRAADTIGMTQSAASMALADLERQLGSQLFNRAGRQLRLNDLGRQLLGQAVEVLDRVAAIEAAARGDTIGFDLHLGYSVTIGNHLIPHIIARLKQRFPEAQLRLSRLNTEHVFEQVEHYKIDLGFVEGPGDSRMVRRIPWKTDQLVIFCAPDHPLARLTVTPEHLSAAEWIMREPGSGTREMMAHALLAGGITPNIAFELEQPEAIRRCVRAGLGIGCLSELELEDAFHAGTLVPLATPFLDMKRNLDVIIHRHKTLTGGLSALLEAADISWPPPG